MVCSWAHNNLSRSPVSSLQLKTSRKNEAAARKQLAELARAGGRERSALSKELEGAKKAAQDTGAGF